MVSDSENVDIYLAAHHPSSVIWDKGHEKKNEQSLPAGGEKERVAYGLLAP